jgi:hypothetical protein
MQSEQEEKREREWWVAEFGARGGIGCNKKGGLQEAMTLASQSQRLSRQYG